MMLKMLFTTVLSYRHVK